MRVAADMVYDYGSEDSMSTTHLDWPFLIKGILEGQTCTPTAPEPLAAILWAIFAVFGIVYALLGYRCLRAVGFLSGLLVGANGIFILQDFQITFLGKPADSALAIVAGLLGAVLGSTYPVASVLISAFAGALLSGAAMAFCVATFPDNEFGYREIYVAVVGGAVICSVLTLCCVKYVTILTSSIVGTAMILSAIDFFTHGLETINWNFVSALQKRIQLSGTETPSERSIKSSSNERNTFRSDRTHFTTIHDPDSELCDKIEIVRDIG
ncbi:GM22989 [Drosophila sechellia]|uniref:Transmembrane protein 198 n=1 Tax=Drosophila sechellia TaxID=7238 RepID=B4I7B4_DROSE|nr:GM22989 [Drosophila sechellia]